MSNGTGPLYVGLKPIEPAEPIHYKYFHDDEEQVYSLGESWTNFENYIEIHGLDPDRYAGPWGSREMDCEQRSVILPRVVANKIAAAILASELHVEYLDPADAPLGNDPGDRAVLDRVLSRVLERDNHR